MQCKVAVVFAESKLHIPRDASQTFAKLGFEMTEATFSRRTLINWVTASVILPIVAANIDTTRFVQTTLPELKADQIFVGHVPSQAKQVITRYSSGIYASVYELRTEETHGFLSFSTQRWLCLASEDEVGKFAIQTSGQALYSSDNFHPADIIDVKILKDGSVEIEEGLLRGITTTRWSKSGINWELAAMHESGVSAHRFYEVKYDREKREYVAGIGGEIGSDAPYEYTKHSVVETFTLAEYGIKSMTG